MQVFFGANMPAERAARTRQFAEQADCLLVLGSSLAVFSAFRLAKAAPRLAIVTVGDTRADALAELKVQALVGEVLPQVAAALAPRT